MNKKSDFKLALFIGARYARTRRGEGFVSFLSLFSGVGITLGVAVLIIVMSIMNGFESELHRRILGMVTHVTINKAIDEPAHIENWEALLEEFKVMPAVVAAAPVIKIQGMLTSRGSVVGVELNGISPEIEKNVSVFPEFMVRGVVENLRPNGSGLVIGAALAQQLALGMGDKVTFVYPKPGSSGGGVIPRFKLFEINGIFSVGSEYDKLFVATDIDTAGQFMEQPGLVSGIRLKLKNLYEAPHLSRLIQNELGNDYRVEDWSVSHGNFFRAVSLEKSMMGFLLLLIVAIAAFNIVSSLVMLVSDKTVDIAILRTLGANDRVIIQVFMIQGMLVGLVGALLGTTAGVLVAQNLAHWVSALEETFQLALLETYFLSYLPSKVEWLDVMVIAVSSIVMALLATVYPARKAAQIEPIEAFQYD
ncbi:MAG: lipoprotein-releasing ABC transporter permease subunit [Gammaproteobacteria bacterium]|nr:lipoprotein-releasing ABC transporter permease subunit [Gammaproteobacteria bacterium]